MKVWLFILAFFLYSLLIYLFLRVCSLVFLSKSQRKKHRIRLICLIGCIVFTLCSFAAGVINAKHIKETDYTVTTEKSLSRPYTIAMISDVHYGTAVNATMLQEVCEKISEQNPDLVILNGDIVDENTTEAEVQEVFQILSKIQSVYGTWFVYGNHEWMASAGQYGIQSPNPELVANALEANNIPVLKDQSFVIENELVLIGRKDRSMARRGETCASISSLTEDLNPNQFWILADHQPADLEKNAETGIDLMISGHTHGGQIWPLGFFGELCGFSEMSYGQRQIGKMQVIVSCGTGVWGFPIRTEHRPEYVMITVRN